MTTRTRTDVHSPTNLVTEDYQYLTCHDLNGGNGGVPRNETEMAALREHNRIVNAARDRDGHRYGQCDHCGAHVRYVAILLHKPTGEHIMVGETCLDNRFERATVEFQRMRKDAELDRQAQRIKGAVADFVTANPDLAFMGDREVPQNLAWNSFVCDLHRKLRTYGELSTRQVDALRRTVTQARERDAQRAASRLAEALTPPAPVANVPTGRQTLSGEVLSVKFHDGRFPGLKMTVRADAGYRVWGSVPARLEVRRGDRVTLTAELEPGDRDPTFGFFKSPKNASVASGAS